VSDQEISETEVWFEVQGKYSGRWEMVTATDTREEALEDLDAYNENEPGTLFRVRRVHGQAE
jgi:hypothetical protein